MLALSVGRPSAEKGASTRRAELIQNAPPKRAPRRIGCLMAARRVGGVSCIALQDRVCRAGRLLALPGAGARARQLLCRDSNERPPLLGQPLQVRIGELSRS